MRTAIARLIEAAVSGGVGHALLDQLLRQAQRPITTTLDELSLELARLYCKGDVSYENAGHVMNQVFSYASSPKYLEENDGDIPSLAFSVYQAFDEGEYVHPQDLATESPEEKYTKPMVAEILRRHQSAA